MKPDMRWRTDADGRCTYVNQTWCSFVGRSIEHELGQGWMDHIHPGDRERISVDVLQCWASRQSFLLHYRLQHHSGQYVEVWDCGHPILVHGEFRGYQGAVVKAASTQRSRPPKSALVIPLTPRMAKAQPAPREVADPLVAVADVG